MALSSLIWPRAATILVLVGFFSSVVGGASGCWFTKGKEGFVCKTSKDCKGKLRCRTYGLGKKSRKQCRPWGKRKISSRSGYTVFAVYLTYIFWIGMPIVVAFVVVRKRTAIKKGGTPPPPGGPPLGQPPPPGPPPGDPPPPTA